MPFDPTLPVTDTDIKSAELRGQFNALNDRDNALAAQIAAVPAGPQGIQGIPGTDGGQGPQGIQGPPGPVPPGLTQNVTFGDGTGARYVLHIVNGVITGVTPFVPPTASGFGDPNANGTYMQQDVWNGQPLYINMASGWCLVYDGNTGWVIWNGDVRAGGGIQSQYNKAGPDPAGTYDISNGAPPGGTIV